MQQRAVLQAQQTLKECIKQVIAFCRHQVDPHGFHFTLIYSTTSAHCTNPSSKHLFTQSISSFMKLCEPVTASNFTRAAA